MITFLHAADLHLDSPMRMLEQYEGAPVDSLRLATRQALTRLVELALDRRVDFVLLAGDIYDGDWKDWNTGLFFAREMSRLHEAKIPVVLIAGNHDAANKMTRQLRLPPNVTMLPADRPGTVTWDDYGVAIHGQSFATAAVTEDLSRRYPDPIPTLTNIGLLHTCAEGRDGHDRYAPCSLDDLKRKGYDYWGLGHIHQREILSTDPVIAFPGNTQGRHIRETGPKGCLLVQIADSGEATTKFVPLHAARWEQLRVQVSAGDTIDTILDRARASLTDLWSPMVGQKLVVRVTLEGTWPRSSPWPAEEQWAGEIRSLATTLADGEIWIEKIRQSILGPSDELTDPDAGGAFQSILRAIGRMRNSPADLDAFKESVDDLLRRLPLELRQDSAEEVGSAHWVRQSLDDVSPMLAEYFRQEEGVSP